MASPTAYLLDTNIFVHLIRGKAVGLAIASNFGLRAGLNRCIISVVTVGEMFALVRKWGWGTQKVADLQKLLGQVVWVDINHPDILESYGELEEVNSTVGRAMGKNDVWIAATAKVTGATLLTTDGDFDHLHPTHLTRVRVDELTGNPLP
jgi:predicted nucleic acid-binding protein